MLRARYPRGIDYLLAVAVTVLVLLGREAIAGLLGRSDPFLPFVGAVLIASWLGGLGPGLLATFLSAMVTDFFFVPPFFSLQIAKLVHGGDLLLFIVLGVLISSLSEKRLRLVRQLRDADRRKDDFLATLAHELRNPLAPIANSVQFFHLNPTPDPKLQKLREIIERQVRQMTRLLDDLLDISRITRDKLELRKESIELASVLECAIETARLFVESQSHDLSIRLPETPIYIEADPMRLAQVFSNLLNNSAKFTPPGGCIHLLVEQHENDVVVRVRDNGIGIAAGDLSRVFEKFTQVGRGTPGTMSGMGIGLALARRLVDMHGGTIDAKSEGLGHGSEFQVRLPLIAPPPPKSTGTRTGERKRVPCLNCRILVVDDNRDSVESLSVLLSASGCKVHKAYDGLQAVKMAESCRPEVVLLDIGMPVLDGYEAARRIRSRDWSSQTVLIALTGWGQEEHLRRSTEAGFDYHLTKPVDLSDLRTLLQNLKERSPLRASRCDQR
jgi:signal transduction histidine kinase/ActR/RegA family two-component response regulator